MDMDINSIGNLYTDYIKNNKDVLSKSIEGKDFSKATDEELMGACKKFEAYFLEQCFKEMWKTTGTAEKSGSMGTLVEYYEENMIQKLSEQSTEIESLGLAQMLYEQMKRNYE